MHLEELGWNEFFQEQLREHENKLLIPARVISSDKNIYTLLSLKGEVHAKLSGKFLYGIKDRIEYPSIGDWVLMPENHYGDFVVISSLLKRKTCLMRKEKGSKTQQQVIAANIDIIFAVIGLTDDFNIRKLERFLMQVNKSGAKPVVLLNKADLCNDSAQKAELAKKSVSSVPILEVSAVTGLGLENLNQYLCKGMTAAFLGASGVGKSTLINALHGKNTQETGELSQSTGKGKHTTTKREFVFLENGGILIDNPGIREMQLWAEPEDLENVFDDIASISKKCRFPDCSHNDEPGCAVREAVETGTLEPGRLKNYRNMLLEIESLKMRQRQKEHLAEKIKKTQKKEKREKKIRICDY